MVLVSTALRLGAIKYLILTLEICITIVIVKGHVYRVPKCDVIENEICELMGFVKIF